MFPRAFNFYNTGGTVELGDLISAGVNIWDFDYPVPRPTIEYNGKTCTVDFDKEKFQQKIIDHYRFRQIGQETVGRWLHYFRTRIKEIMPYYVQLYEFDAKFRNIDDPLESYTLKEEYERTGEGSSRSSDTSESGTSTGSESTRIFSNTPQGEISNLDKYMTEGTKESSETAGTVNATSSGDSETLTKEAYTLLRRGNIGVQPLGGEVENIRNAFINIDQMVINELKDLFLMVY